MLDIEAIELLPEALKLVEAVDRRDQIECYSLIETHSPAALAVLCAGAIGELQNQLVERDRIQQERVLHDRAVIRTQGEEIARLEEENRELKKNARALWRRINDLRTALRGRSLNAPSAVSS